jgi:radical SAM superfamily enzyme YgiQ (UPF0313 family)
MRLDGIDPSLIDLLGRLGVRTLTCAPEAGSQRMRNVIRKALNEEEILRSVEMIGRGEIRTLKLYFMIGLPFEEIGDIEAIIELVRKIREVVWRVNRRTRIQLKVNPFVPKPFTPFQWAPMDRDVALRSKVARLRGEIRRIPAVSMKVGNLRGARIQGILARGDRRLAPYLLDVAHGDVSLPVALRRDGKKSAFYLYRERSEDEIFPWDFIDHGYSKEWLLREWRRAGRAASGSVHQGA